MGKKIIKSIYGSVALLKGYCKKCKEYSFIIDGEYQCCNALSGEIYKKEIKKRESIGESRRSYISQKMKRDILESQNSKCIYCEKKLEEYFWHNLKGKHVKLRIHFDHFVSWNYSRDNHRNNIYASCHLCNGIKSDKYFYDLISAKEFINERRKEKGI